MVNYSFTIGQLELFLLILVRIASFVFIAPFFSNKNFPAIIKVGTALTITILMFGQVPNRGIEYDSILGYSVIVIKEVLVGLLTGLAATLCNSIILFFGKLVDMDIGLSMMTIFDPTSNDTSSVTGTFYNYLLMFLLLISNLHQYILRALLDSYKVIPVNGLNFDYSKLYESIVRFMSNYMIIGFRIELPIFACLLVVNVVLGIMAKVSPQMNMFAVGMQIKIIVGLVVLYLTIGLLPQIADFIFDEMKATVVSFMESMY